MKLGNDDLWELLVNDDRVLLRSRPIGARSDAAGASHDEGGHTKTWTVLSHAVLNGGLRSIDDGSRVQILNAKVPNDYDGLSPNPRQLLQQLAGKETDPLDDNKTTIDGDNHKDESFTVGLLTAASMNSMRVATRSATGQKCQQTCIVDVIVTAGISNARAAGATADVFSFTYLPENDGNSNRSQDSDPSPSDDKGGTGNVPSKSKQHFGTINSVILISSCLEETTALVEAYSVAVEAKCKAAADLGIRCAKSPSEAATGTGTDTAVLICRNQGACDASHVIPYAGKHTLLGELIGQAVYEATTEALGSNLEHLYKAYRPILDPKLAYRLDCIRHGAIKAIQDGHRPVIPSQPMKPIPGPNGLVLAIGLIGLAFSFGIHLYEAESGIGRIEAAEGVSWKNGPTFHLHGVPRPSVSVLLAVMFADRFLGSFLLPLAIHPVVRVGSLITRLLRIIPESCFDPNHPVLGLVAGCLLFVVTMAVALATALIFLLLPSVLWSIAASECLDDADETCSNSGWSGRDVDGFLLIGRCMLTLATWSAQVFLLRGSLSIQLLCALAMQMSDFLERRQLQEARGSCAGCAAATRPPCRLTNWRGPPSSRYRRTCPTA